MSIIFSSLNPALTPPPPPMCVKLSSLSEHVGQKYHKETVDMNLVGVANFFFFKVFAMADSERMEGQQANSRVRRAGGNLIPGLGWIPGKS